LIFLTANEIIFKNRTSTNYPSTEEQITIPFGTDQTNINKTTFLQSLIDNATMNNPQVNLYDKITNGEKYATTMKTLVGNDIFPKTTNTMLTVYYTSYIKTNLPQPIDYYYYKPLVKYYCTNKTVSAINVSVMNSTLADPQFYISITKPTGSIYKSYVVAASEPKVVIDLTADLASIRPVEEIVFAQFPAKS
jgi:hypothetical protein